MKKIRSKKNLTINDYLKKILTIFKIILFQYFILIPYALFFSIPLLLWDESINLSSIILILLFIIIFPLFQSIFHIHYINTGSLYSRFEVWMGTMFFYLLVPILTIIL